MSKILHIDSSAAKSQSNSRTLSKAIVEQLNPKSVTYRDVSEGLPVLTEAHINASFTPEESRTQEQKQILSLSDQLVEEIFSHDIIVIGVPMYNFGMPASMKLYIDLIARAGLTFLYSESGEKGLVEDKKVYFALTSGGVPLDSGLPIDHLTASLKTFFNFLGMSNQTIVSASGLA